MKKTRIILFVLIAIGSSFFMQGGLQRAQIPVYKDFAAVFGQKGEIDLGYGRLPLYFIENNAQANTDALFYARTRGYSLMLIRQGMVFAHTPPEQTASIEEWDGFSLEFLGSDSDTEVIPVDQAEYRVNYFIGSDAKKWKTNVPTSKAVLYKELYPDIDLKIYGRENQIEYDWIVQPGGDVSQIKISFTDVQETRLDKENDLTIVTELGEFKHLKPVCYQKKDGARIPVAGSFIELATNTFGISVADYDKDHALIVDPIILVYSTYLGTKEYDDVHDIAVDPTGAAYITGWSGFLFTPPLNSDQDRFISSEKGVYVTKINPAGSKLVYTSYFGGSHGAQCYALAVDKSGAVYLVGNTRSADFPLKNPFQASHKGSDDVFIFKLNHMGDTLLYSSFLGGTGQDWGTGIAIDKKGAAYITGMITSADFPLKKAFQKTYQGAKQGYPWDAFIAKIHPKGIRLVYSSYLGGNGGDSGYAVAVNNKGEAYVTGYTASTNFPRKKSVQKKFAGGSDAFVCKLSRQGNRLLYSTFLGGDSWDRGNSITVDAKGAAYVIGDTESYDFPVKSAVQAVLIKDYDESENDVFVTKLSPSGAKIVYSTFLGGGKYEAGNDIAVDSQGAAYICGVTESKNFPVKDPFQQSKKGITDAFICKLHPNGQSLLFSSFLGGSGSEYGTVLALGSIGNIYITGTTSSRNFPLKNAIQKKKLGKKDSMDIFVTKMQLK